MFYSMQQARSPTDPQRIVSARLANLPNHNSQGYLPRVGGLPVLDCSSRLLASGDSDGYLKLWNMASIGMLTNGSNVNYKSDELTVSKTNAGFGVSTVV